MVDMQSAPENADDPSSSMSSLNTVVGADNIELEIDIDNQAMGDEGSLYKVLRSAVTATLGVSVIDKNVPVELYVRVVGSDDSQQLNHEYRGKDKPTNVLSFPAIDPHEIQSVCERSVVGGPPLLLGDIIIAAPVIVEEAAAQKKTVEDHLSHMAVHGVLHLIGYDHVDDQDAIVMEDLERKILKSLGIADPYQNEFNHDG